MWSNQKPAWQVPNVLYSFTKKQEAYTVLPWEDYSVLYSTHVGGSEARNLVASTSTWANRERFSQRGIQPSLEDPLSLSIDYTGGFRCLPPDLDAFANLGGMNASWKVQDKTFSLLSWVSSFRTLLLLMIVGVITALAIMEATTIVLTNTSQGPCQLTSGRCAPPLTSFPGAIEATWTLPS